MDGKRCPRCNKIMSRLSLWFCPHCRTYFKIEKGKVHFAEKDQNLTLCGKRRSEINVTDDPYHITCGTCRRIQQNHPEGDLCWLCLGVGCDVCGRTGYFNKGCSIHEG